MGLLQIDLPPIQLHASTQCDTRTPEKARFLQDVGFSKIILARELDLQQIRAVRAQVDRATLEFFIHGALCVAYSGQCFISHAHTGRSANRGSCSQECRLPYTVTDGQGRVIAHEKHVLSIKDNDQSANLRRADRRRRAQLQDRGPLQGPRLRQERHRALPAAARRAARRPPPTCGTPRRAARRSPSRPIRSATSTAAPPTTSSTAAATTSARSTAPSTPGCRSATWRRWPRRTSTSS